MSSYKNPGRIDSNPTCDHALTHSLRGLLLRSAILNARPKRCGYATTQPTVNGGPHAKPCMAKQKQNAASRLKQVP